MKRSLFAIGAGLTLAVGAVSSFASPDIGAEPIDQENLRSLEAQTLSYWTREMVATAPAIQIPVDTGLSGIVPLDDKAPESLGTSGFAEGGEAAKDSLRFHKNAYSQDWENLENMDWGKSYLESQGMDPDLSENGEGDAFRGTAGIYTDYPVNEKTQLWTLYPHRWSGKFTFTTPAGNSSCSATVIRNNHIVTAAHCVYDTPSRNRWYTNKAFTPAYRNGSAPFGTFPTAGCRILPAWIAHSGGYSINSWARNDVAVCRMGRNSAGRTINSAVGWAGYSWNWGYSQLSFNAGYPARSFTDAFLPSPAQWLRSCTAETFRQTTDTLGMGCQYGRGISGGGWMRGYKANYITGQVNSVNSGLFIGSPNLYGARFTTNNIVSLCNLNGC